MKNNKKIPKILLLIVLIVVSFLAIYISTYTLRFEYKVNQTLDEHFKNTYINKDVVFDNFYNSELYKENFNKYKVHNYEVIVESGGSYNEEYERMEYHVSIGFYDSDFITVRIQERLFHAGYRGNPVGKVTMYFDPYWKLKEYKYVYN